MDVVRDTEAVWSDDRVTRCIQALLVSYFCQILPIYITPEETTLTTRDIPISFICIWCLVIYYCFVVCLFVVYYISPMLTHITYAHTHTHRHTHLRHDAIYFNNKITKTQTSFDEIYFLRRTSKAIR